MSEIIFIWDKMKSVKNLILVDTIRIIYVSYIQLGLVSHSLCNGTNHNPMEAYPSPESEVTSKGRELALWKGLVE